jgi:voltage-gated potassium channel
MMLRRLPGRFTVLLVSILVVGGVIPVIEDLRGGGNPIVAEAIFIVPLVAGCYAALERKRLFVVLLAIGVLATIAQALETEFGDARLSVSGGLLMIVFFGLMAVSIFRFVLRTERVTGETIAAALCVYLLIGLIWAFAYSVLQTLRPAALRPDHAPIWEFIYYSFATLTTVGYADVVATSRIAKSFATIEAVAGQFYLAVIISQLISLRIVHATSGDAAGEG